ncbi:uncharacterized protein IUM83_04107 [Phytophthora cinnamomi]|uniref:uncharacterized protein n=1 Tax=Phytophthora cinnamomi TaxID=4785 RepID=UPI00355AAD3F|nr:hypothetical protein IUM83_04107 [Phytophthora cinnamomi]
MPGDSESDVFPALFGALRDRLAVRVSTLDGATDVDQMPPPSRVLTASSSPSDALLKSLSASDSSVGSRVLQEIRADVRANKLQLLRRKRLRLRKTREAKQRQKQRLDAVASAECDAVLLDATTHGQKFQLFLADTHAKAVARLRTLFYECAAEMKKALVRMENVAADTTEESESRRVTPALRVGVISRSTAAGLRWRHRRVIAGPIVILVRDQKLQFAFAGTEWQR